MGGGGAAAAAPSSPWSGQPCLFPAALGGGGWGGDGAGIDGGADNGDDDGAAGDVILVNPRSFEGGNIPTDLTFAFAKYVAETSNVASEDWARRFRFDDVLWPPRPRPPSPAGTSSSAAESAAAPFPSTTTPTSPPPPSSLLPLATAICDDAVVASGSAAGTTTDPPARSSSFECACLAYGSPGSGRSRVLFGDCVKVGVGRRGGPGGLRGRGGLDYYASSSSSTRDGVASAGLVELVVGGILRSHGEPSSGGGRSRRRVTVSILEVRGEDRRDGLRDLLLLLPTDGGGRPHPADGPAGKHSRRSSLRVLEHEDRMGAIVRNLTEEVVDSVESLRGIMARANQERSAGTVDGGSSGGGGGGHVIVTVKVYDSPRRQDTKSFPICTMQFVDLASSDGGGETDRDADVRHSHFVRKSLSALGALLRKLVVVQGGSSASSSSSSSASYRESILTRLLKRTLDPPGARAVLIAAVRQESRFYHQTLHSLNYANRLLSRPGTTARAPFLGGGRRGSVAMTTSSSPGHRPLVEEGGGEDRRGTTTPVRGVTTAPRSSCSPFRRASSASKSSLANVPREITGRGSSPTKASPEEIQRALFDHLIDQGSGGVRSDLLHSQVSDPRQRVAKFAKAFSGWTPPDSIGNGSVNGSHHASAGTAARMLPPDGGGGGGGSSNVEAVRGVDGDGDRVPSANRATVLASNARGRAPHAVIGGMNIVQCSTSSLVGHFEREIEPRDDDDHDGELHANDDAFRTVDVSASRSTSTAAAHDDWRITGMDDAVIATTTESSKEGQPDRKESFGDTEASLAVVAMTNAADVERANRDAASGERPDVGITRMDSDENPNSSVVECPAKEEEGLDDGVKHREAWSDRGKVDPSGPLLATDKAFADGGSPVTCDDECYDGRIEDFDDDGPDAEDRLRGCGGRLDRYPKDASLAETKVPRWPSNGSTWENSQDRRRIEETSPAFAAMDTTTSSSTVLLNGTIDWTRGYEDTEEKFDRKEDSAGGKKLNDEATSSQSPVRGELHQEGEHPVDGRISIGGAPTSNESHGSRPDFTSGGVGFTAAAPSPPTNAGESVEPTPADPLEEYVETATAKMEDQAGGTLDDYDDDYDKQTEASFASGAKTGSAVVPEYNVAATAQPGLADSVTKGIEGTPRNDVGIPVITSSNHGGIGPSAWQVSGSEQVTLPDDESVRVLLQSGPDFEKFRSSIFYAFDTMETEQAQFWKRLSDAFLSLAVERDSAVSRVRSIEQHSELARAQLTEEKGRADEKLADALHALELTREEMSRARHQSKLDLRAERENATVELEELRSELGRREQTLEGLIIECDHLKVAEKSSRTKLSDAVQERESLRTSLRDALDRCNDVGLDLGRLREQLLATQREVQELKIANTEAIRTRNLAEDDLEERNIVLSRTRKELAETEQSKIECEATIESINMELEEARSSLYQSEWTRAETQSKYDALKLSTEAELSVVSDECASLRQKLAEAQEVSTRDEEERSLLQKYRRDLEGRNDKSQRALRDLRLAKEQAEEDFTGTLANLESVKKELESRNQSVHNLQIEIDVLRSGAKESTNVIQEGQKKAEELQLSRDTAQEKLRDELRARTRLERSLEKAEEDEHICNRARETLQEQLTGVEDTLKHSEASRRALELSKGRVEMQLQESLEDARLSKQECARAKHAIDELGSENERLTHELSNAASSLKSCETFELDMTAKYERLRASESEAQQKLQVVREEHPSIEERIRIANDDVERICQERDNLKGRLAQAEDKLCDPQYVESLHQAADLKAENQVLAGEAAKLRSSLQKSEDAIKWMKQQCDRYTSSAAHITKVQLRTSTNKQVLTDRSVQVSSGMLQDNGEVQTSSSMPSVDVKGKISESPPTDSRAERLKRIKAEKLCADFAIRAKSSIDKRNAEILRLKMKLSKVSEQKDSEISSLQEKLSAEVQQREKAEQMTATISSRAKEKLENQSFEAEELRTMLASERVERKNVLSQFSASAEMDEVNESNKLWAFVRKQDSVDEIREKLLVETQKERDEALKGLRKYKKMTRRLVQQLQDLDDRLPVSLHRDTSAENAIANGLPPPKVITNQPS